MVCGTITSGRLQLFTSKLCRLTIIVVLIAGLLHAVLAMNAKTFEARIEKLKKQAARDHALRVAEENEERFDRMYERDTEHAELSYSNNYSQEN